MHAAAPARGATAMNIFLSAVQARVVRAVKALLFVLWALVMWQITAWTFFPERPQTAPAPVLRADGKGYNENEPVIVRGRELQRAGALKALEQPFTVLCSEEGRKRVVSSLNHYFYHRQNQMLRYPANFGKPGADYIAQQWSTADDRRIDRLIREAYGRGHIAPDDLEKGYARNLLVSVVNGIRVTGKGCAA
jgi:hypothetical protein